MSRPDVSSSLLEWEVIWMTGLVLSAIVYGSLITIGIQCLLAKSNTTRKREEKRFSLHRILKLHVALVLAVNTFLQIWNIKSHIKEIVFMDPSHFTFFLRNWTNIFVVFLAGLTDGLLVWRCYMVQKALFRDHPAGFHNVCWIFPLIIYISSLPIGVASVVFLDPHIPIESYTPPGIFIRGTGLAWIAMLMNIVINIFATCNIIICLLLYRRTIISTFGKSSALAEHSLRISYILLESAALNIPVTIATFLGATLNVNYVSVMMDIVVPGQSIASVLVNYQVMRGRVISGNVGNSDSQEIFGAGSSEVRAV